MWDLFYKRNSTNFFKDRHWTFREFEELKVKHLCVSHIFKVTKFFVGKYNCKFLTINGLMRCIHINKFNFVNRNYAKNYISHC